MGTKFNDRCPYKRYTEETDRKGGYIVTLCNGGKDGSKVATRQWKRQRTDYPLKPPEGGKAALPAPLFQTPGLQKCEKITFYCVKAPRCGHLL